MLAFCDACHSLALPASATGGGRALSAASRRRTVAVTASRFASRRLLAFCDGCHSLALPASATGGGRARPSRRYPALGSKLDFDDKK
ncbi:MAG: hypothetical protein IKC75_04670 [Clostridia bacterium]|nr:hypothetical protein [Clostridia bacterium]